MWFGNILNFFNLSFSRINCNNIYYLIIIINSDCYFNLFFIRPAAARKFVEDGVTTVEGQYAQTLTAAAAAIKKNNFNI